MSRAKHRFGFGRTDLKDDVRTGRYVDSLDEARAMVERLAAHNYGARLSDDHFSVVDSYSDG